MLTGILQQEQGPEGFLNATFSFLNVNTDFFIERNENVKFGLPLDEAKSMVDRVFTKHKILLKWSSCPSSEENVFFLRRSAKQSCKEGSS